MSKFNFETLRKANTLRLPVFKNRKGEPAHANPDGSDWSLNDWYTAVMGEAGELGSVLKQVRRGDITLEEALPDIAQEAADVVTYLDILTKQCGIDLGEATRIKFNVVSSRIGVRIYIDESNNVLTD